MYYTHNVSIPQAAQLRLIQISKETNRTIENIIATTIEQCAINYFRHRKDDPVELLKKAYDDDQIS